MRMRIPSLVVFILGMALMASCADEATPEVPSGAHTTPDGARWIRVRSGCGLTGADGEFWSVEWSYVPADDFGVHVYNGKLDAKLYDPFRDNLVSMKEGERRRVWVPNQGKDEYWVADLH